MTFRRRIIEAIGVDGFDAEGHIVFQGGAQLDTLQQALDEAPSPTAEEVSWFTEELKRLGEQVRKKIGVLSDDGRERLINTAFRALKASQKLRQS